MPSLLRRCCWIIPGLVLLASTASLAQAKPRLLASIKPLALIAQEVAGVEVAVDTLLPASASPHDYPLKMSDHRRLRDADLVLWIGPELEAFLAKPLRNLPQAQQLSAYGLAGIQWPEAEDVVQEGQVAHDHGHHSHDPHLWLNPHNAALLATALAERMAQLQPASAAVFRARAQAFAQAMALLDQRLQAELAPFRERGFAVYHEGYGHFVQHYGLRQLAYITFTPERRPGARHLHQLRQLMAADGVCIFSEPYQGNQSLDTLARELKLRQGQLDALGAESVETYGQLLERMAQAFATCLAAD